MSKQTRIQNTVQIFKLLTDIQKKNHLVVEDGSKSKIYRNKLYKFIKIYQKFLRSSIL